MAKEAGMAENSCKQVDARHYRDEGFSPLRIESVTQQLREIAFSGCRSILEIGVGRGMVKHFLHLFPDIQHVGLDLAKDVNPDVVASVLDMPFSSGQFELTLCGQVLEHLPFDEFLPALREIRRVTEKRVVLSLPDIRKHIGMAFRIPGFDDWVRWEFHLDRPDHGKKVFDGQHYWEIGYRGTTGRSVRNRIREAGFTIDREYRLDRHRWHCFFILRVR